MKLPLAAALALLAALGTSSLAKADTLDGTTLTGYIEIPSRVARNFSIVQQFNPTAVVGPGIEFSGVVKYTDYFGYSSSYNIFADFTGTDLVYTITGSLAGVATIPAIPLLVFSGFPTSFTGYPVLTSTCSTSIVSRCIPSIFDEDQYNVDTYQNGVLTVGTTNLVTGTVYTYTNPSAVTSPTPEPASLTLFGTGLAALGGLARRKLRRA